MSSLEASALFDQALTRTAVYAQIFGTDISPEIFSFWLLSPRYYPFDQVNSQLQQRDNVSFEYSSSWQKQSTAPQWHEATRLVRHIAWIPWIQSIWVTGSVAARSASPEDDVDIMIITDNNRLWLTRFIVVLWSKVLGKYRGREETDNLALRWCLNLWLEQKSILSLAAQPSLYIAREVVQAVPVYERSFGMARNFIVLNSWVRYFTANGWLTALAQTSYVWKSSSSQWWMNLCFCFSPLWWVGNKLAWHAQRMYMQPHQSRERVRYDAAFFHPRDTETWMHKKYEKILRDYEQQQQSIIRATTE